MARLSRDIHQEIFKESQDVNKINKFRISMGIRPIEPKIRECLKCSRDFESQDINNRVCYGCSKQYGLYDQRKRA